LEIYAAKGKKLEDTIIPVLEPHLDQWYQHIKIIITTVSKLLKVFLPEKYEYKYVELLENTENFHPN
jgi:hypothetical protein